MGKPGTRLTESALGVMQRYSVAGQRAGIGERRGPGRGPVHGPRNWSRSIYVSHTTTKQKSQVQEEEPQVREASDLSYHEAMEHYRYYLIEQALKRARGNQTKAAEALGLQRSYLARVLKQKRADAQKDDP